MAPNDAADTKPNPRATSNDYDAMAPYWQKVNAILGGAETMRAVALQSVAGPHYPKENLASLNRGRWGPESPYLPRFPNESSEDYEVRRKTAPFTNVYGDISRNLSSKPFTKLLELDDGSAADLKKLQENIDGQGNNLHVFSRDYFKTGLDKAVAWVLVEYTKVPPGTSLAAERQMGARPYWVHVPPERLIAVYSTFINGTEVVNHARIYDPRAERVGFAEKQCEYVRVFNREPIVDEVTDEVKDFAPATWELWEEVETTAQGTTTVTREWVLRDAGPVTIGIIPLVPFRTGRRDGMRWIVEPPLRDLANMQVTEFQQESSLDSIKTLAAFPMLVGAGVKQSKNANGEAETVPVGPRVVLFAPMNDGGQHGDWKYIEPAATSLTFLAADLEKIRTEMRDLGMQPLTAANLTVITTANVAMKANSAVQAWTIGFKDSLEQAWKITCMWLNRPKESPTVNVHKDFAAAMSDSTDLDALLKGEAQGVWSKETVREEFKRRGKVSDDLDLSLEDEKIAKQVDPLVGEQTIDPVTGKPIPLSPPPGKPIAKPAIVN